MRRQYIQKRTRTQFFGYLGISLSHRSGRVASASVRIRLRVCSQPVRDEVFLSQQEIARHSFLHWLEREVIEIEISSQLHEFIAAFGRLPDFIDGHQHVHLFPQIREALAQCGKGCRTKRLGAAMRADRSIAQAPGRRKGNCARRTEQRVPPPRQPVWRAIQSRLAGTYAFAKNADYAQIFPRFLRGLPDGSVVMCHPGFVDAELQRLDPLTTLREREYLFLIDDSFPGLLDAHGVTLLPRPPTNSYSVTFGR
jgi:predicted glycoside hydrolase/deacetylase ChbG (UPF0249 family)